jgi:hypothetical protein
MIGVLALVALSFLVGYIPEHRRYVRAMGDLQFTDSQLRDALGRERVYHLENILLQALDRAAHKEYKEAQTLAADFFLEVRSDMARPDMDKFTPELKAILDKSDSIKEALEKEDQSARDLMRGVMQQLARMAGPRPAPNEPPPVISVTPPPQG